MPTTTMTSKGQITIPKAIRDGVNAHEGTQFDVRIDGAGNVVLAPKKRLSLRDLLAKYSTPAGPPHTVEEMNQAVLDRCAEDNERIRHQYSRPSVHKR